MTLDELLLEKGRLTFTIEKASAQLNAINQELCNRINEEIQKEKETVSANASSAS